MVSSLTLPGDLSKPGIKPESPALQADSLLSKPPEKLTCTTEFFLGGRLPKGGCHRLLCKSWLPGFIKLFSIHSHGNWLWIICVILNNDNRISTMILYSWCYCYISLAISFIKLQLFPNKKTTFYSGSFITKDKDVSIFITLGLITLCILNNAFKVRV